ncbi:hypothetical protein QVD17_32717 [Tagetes erecta]|uniref:Uncharacterized protein n=1 Tax=Tagetes erecta TaxID=13708 RepID=A0AAD8NDH9_TARER|nr:hypothetical protein QVD17_32717 [Tagetes erecta]
MSVTNLVTALTIIFIISVVFLVAELIFILRQRHRRVIRPQSSQQHVHVSSGHSTKDLLYFFCLKTETRVKAEPTGALKSNPNGCPPDNSEIQETDVIKVFETKGSSRVLCTIKEDDTEEVESTSITVVDTGEIVCLQACFESEEAVERPTTVALEVEGTKTMFSSPCDSPVFYTPVGTPSRDGEYVSPVSGK